MPTWIAHVEFFTLLIAILGAFFVLDAKIERQSQKTDQIMQKQTERTDQIMQKQTERTDKLYEMFIELVKERKEKK